MPRESIGISTLVYPRPTEYGRHIDDFRLALSMSVGMTSSIKSITDVCLKNDAKSQVFTEFKRIFLAVLPHLAIILPPVSFECFNHPCLVSDVVIYTNLISGWYNPLAMSCRFHNQGPLRFPHKGYACRDLNPRATNPEAHDLLTKQHGLQVRHLKQLISRQFTQVQNPFIDQYTYDQTTAVPHMLHSHVTRSDTRDKINSYTHLFDMLWLRA